MTKIGIVTIDGPKMPKLSEFEKGTVIRASVDRDKPTYGIYIVGPQVTIMGDSRTQLVSLEPGRAGEIVSRKDGDVFIKTIYREVKITAEA